MAKEVKRIGYDQATADRFAALIGDTPIMDGTGRIIVLDEQGRELAALDLKFSRERSEC